MYNHMTPCFTDPDGKPEARPRLTVNYIVVYFTNSYLGDTSASNPCTIHNVGLPCIPHTQSQLTCTRHLACIPKWSGVTSCYNVYMTQSHRYKCYNYNIYM